MEQEMEKKLVTMAREARKNAYAPYSGYFVGAAVLTTDGDIYTGCNVENASYGLTNCAERTAIFKAVSEGARKLRAIAIAGPEDGNPPYPCGACRQVLSEFAESGEMPVFVTTGADVYQTYQLKELLPYSFNL